MSIFIKQFKGNKTLSSAEFVTLFKKYDKDGNGLIERDELDPFLADICEELGEENQLSCDIKELKKMILNQYDDNKDNKLSMEEMSKILPTANNFLLEYRKDVKLTSIDFMKIWYHYDLDKSGFLEEAELEGFIHDFLKKANKDKKKSLTPADINEQKTKLLENLDSNKDGKISLSELSELLPTGENFFRNPQLGDTLSEAQFEEIFSHYDKDKNGEIEECELMALLKDLLDRPKGSKSNMSDLEIFKKQIMAIVDTNKDGKVARSELRLLLSN